MSWFKRSSVAAERSTLGSADQLPFLSASTSGAPTLQYSLDCGHRPWSVKCVASKLSAASLAHSGFRPCVSQKLGSQLSERTASALPAAWPPPLVEPPAAAAAM